MSIDSPCVVLEDDARIPNLEIFELVVASYLEKHSNDKSILSLVPWKHENKSTQNLNLAPEIIGLSGSTPTTVAYVITPKSMKEMSDSNSDFSFLPDWPPSSVKFYTTIHGVVTHGDSNTTSLIDSVGRKKTKRSQNLLKLTFLPFVLNRSLFTNIGEYYNISSSEFYSNLEVTRRLLSYFDKDESSIEFVEDRKGHDFRYAINSQKIRSELGWSPKITFPTGLVSTIEWYLQNPEYLKNERLEKL